MPKTSSVFYLKSHIPSFVTGQEKKNIYVISFWQPTYLSTNAQVIPDVLRASLNNEIIMQ